MLMNTQWRFAPMGMAPSLRCGLDYAALPLAMEMARVPKKERRNVFNDIRIMEDEALMVFLKQRST